jgi:hypothetical protein
MQGYIKVSAGPFIPVHYKGLVEASMQGYIKESVGAFITVHYNG